MEELQNTKTNGDMISSEMIIRFSDIKIDDFLKYRKTIREITGFGKIGISQTIINEKALINENNLERKPEIFREALTPSIPPNSPVFPSGPTKKLPGQPKKKVDKGPYLSQKSRCFLASHALRGAPHEEIIKTYRQNFRKTKNTDAEIIQLFNRANGIR
jgi:hypothetical protein